jgi:hypothetical protein
MEFVTECNARILVMGWSEIGGTGFEHAALPVSVDGVVIENCSGDVQQNKRHHPIRLEDAWQVRVLHQVIEHPCPKQYEWYNDNQGK